MESIIKTLVGTLITVAIVTIALWPLWVTLAAITYIFKN